VRPRRTDTNEIHNELKEGQIQKAPCSLSKDCNFIIMCDTVIHELSVKCGVSVHVSEAKMVKMCWSLSPYGGDINFIPNSDKKSSVKATVWKADVQI